VILLILLVGLIVTLITKKVPDDWLSPVFKQLILWTAVVGIIIWLIYLFAPASLWQIRTPH